MSCSIHSLQPRALDTTRRVAPRNRSCAPRCRAQRPGAAATESSDRIEQSSLGQRAVAGFTAAAVLLSAQAGFARQVLPPIDSDPRRCERAYVGNTIGQANAVADKILDLRKCSYAGKDLSKKVLSGALLVDSDLSNTTLIETVLTKAIATNANFAGANLTNAIVDRVDFRNSDLSGVRFKNTVVTGSNFTDAKLDNVVFEDALIGREDVKKLCANPSLQGEARQEVGCRN